MSATYCKITFFTSSLISFLLFLAALFMIFFIPGIVEQQIKKTLPFLNTSSSQTFKEWQKIPFGIVTKIYLFNITNPNKVENFMEPPHLQEVGPYVFEERREKLNISWSEDKNLVFYKQRRTWRYIPELTNGSLNDSIYHISMPLVTAGERLKGNNFFVTSTFNSVSKKLETKLVDHHTIEKLLFKGYDDPLMNFSKKLFQNLPLDKFGWFYNRNNSVEGYFGVYTGVLDIHKLDEMYSFKNNTKLTYWSGDECNSLADTSAASFYTPFSNTTPEHIKMFFNDICRSVKLNFVSKVKSRGLNLNRYAVDSSLFNYTFQKNKCYCISNRCPPDGLSSLSSCQFDSPTAVSLPHFLYGDPRLLINVKGLNPDLEKHGIFIDVEPTLGIPVKIKLNIQINVKIERNLKLAFSKMLNHDTLWVPAFWLAANVDVDKKVILKLKLVQNLSRYIYLVSCIMIMFAVAIILLTIFFKKHCFNKFQQIPTSDKAEFEYNKPNQFFEMLNNNDNNFVNKN